MWPSNPFGTTFAFRRSHHLRPSSGLHCHIHPCCDYRPNCPMIHSVDSAPIRFPGSASQYRDSATSNRRRSAPDSCSVCLVQCWPGCLDAAAHSSTCPVALWPDCSGAAVRSSACPAGRCSHQSSLHSHSISAIQNLCFGTHSRRVLRTCRHSSSSPRTYFHTRWMTRSLSDLATPGPKPLSHSPLNSAVSWRICFLKRRTIVPIAPWGSILDELRHTIRCTGCTPGPHSVCHRPSMSKRFASMFPYKGCRTPCESPSHKVRTLSAIRRMLRFPCGNKPCSRTLRRHHTACPKYRSQPAPDGIVKSDTLTRPTALRRLPTPRFVIRFCGPERLVGGRSGTRRPDPRVPHASPESGPYP